MNLPSVLVTSESLNWEEEYDYSKEEFPIQIIKPSDYIFKKMELVYGKKEGEFVNEDGNVTCLDPSVFNKSKSYLLIKKLPFLKFLNDNELELFWVVSGEKNIVGGDMNFKEGFTGWLMMKEVYWLENESISGIQQTDIG